MPSMNSSFTLQRQENERSQDVPRGRVATRASENLATPVNQDLITDSNHSLNITKIIDTVSLDFKYDLANIDAVSCECGPS
jgi:hypothetical protein